MRSDALRRQRDEGVSLLKRFQDGLAPSSEVFDVELLARYLAICDL